MFRVILETKNAAFTIEPGPQAEIAAILRNLASRVEAEPEPARAWSVLIFDTNGNACGSASWEA